MEKALQGKIALVTGGSSGIGLAIAKRFVAEGARVVITSRKKPDLDRAVAELGASATGVRADVTKSSDLDAVFKVIQERFGRLDVVAANAGGGSFEPLGGITEANYQQTFDTNVKGVIFTVQKSLPLLSSGASILVTGSTASVTGTPAFSVYGASKAAVRSLVRSWILDLKGRGIRVNVLSPGPTKTPGLVGLVPPEHEQSLLTQLANEVPLGRVADADEIGKAAVFLASDASSFVNGAELFVDGGAAQI